MQVSDIQTATVQVSWTRHIALTSVSMILACLVVVVPLAVSFTNLSSQVASLQGSTSTIVSQIADLQNSTAATTSRVASLASTSQQLAASFASLNNTVFTSVIPPLSAAPQIFNSLSMQCGNTTYPVIPNYIACWQIGHVLFFHAWLIVQCPSPHTDGAVSVFWPCVAPAASTAPQPTPPAFFYAGGSSVDTNFSASYPLIQLVSQAGRVAIYFCPQWLDIASSTNCAPLTTALLDSYDGIGALFSGSYLI